jgi:hypothetical protein
MKIQMEIIWDIINYPNKWLQPDCLISSLNLAAEVAVEDIRNWARQSIYCSCMV